MKKEIIKKWAKRGAAVLLTAVLVLGAAVSVFAADAKPFLSLGADLTAEQQATVLSLLGVDATQIDNYSVSYVTNAEEHQYLDNLIDPSAIGTKSLSSVVVYEAPEGSGLSITTKNITFCTEGMYRNACATAGIKDATIVVAGPSNISGTAALVGIIKAYQEMSGETIDVDTINGALSELVVTGNIEGALSDIDPETIEQLLAYLKNYMAENNLHDASSIGAAVDQAAQEYGVTLSDSEKNQIVDLLVTLDKLDLDPSALSGMVSGYQKVSSAASSIGDFFKQLGDAISGFFKGLFGGNN